jgi:hypothetical protein
VFRRAPRPGLNLVAPVAVGALTAAVILGRLFATGDPLDRMWAEDGKNFLANGDRWSSFIDSYAGYGHLVLRTLGFVGAHLPVPYWAAYAVVAATLVVSALAGFVYTAARELTGSVPAAVVAALALSLTPALAFEALGSIANLQWYLLVGTLWALLLPASSLRWPAAVVAGLAAASTILTVLLLPVALLVHRRDVLRVRSVQGLLAGLAFQALVVALGRTEPGGPERHSGFPEHMGAQLAYHLGGTQVQSPVVVWVAVAGVAFVLVLGWLHAGPLRPHLAAAVGSGIVLLIVTTYLSGEMASRYIATASMLVLAGAAIAVGSFTWSLPALGALAAVAVLAFPAHTIKFSGPSWAAGVAAWAQRCDAGAASADIPVSPEGWGEAEVSCTHR